MTKEAPTAFAKKIKQGHDAMNFRYSFAMQAADFSPPVATALALRWVDRDIKKGAGYIYIITVNGGNKNEVVDSAATFLADTKAKSIPAPDGLTAYGFDRRIELHWNRRQSGHFSAYYIERSDDEGRTFHALNKLPYYTPDQAPPTQQKDTNQHKIATLLHDHQIYFDSIPQDYKPYYYRVRGINAFAELSPWSPVAMIQGRDLTAHTNPHPSSIRPGTPTAPTSASPGPSAKPIPTLPATISAGRVASRDRSIRSHPPCSPKATKTFTDTAALPHLPNYYVVIAVDTAKNVSASIRLSGFTLPTPSPPQRQPT